MRSESNAGLEKREAALTRLIDEYEPALRRLANFYESEGFRREDLLQEILLGLWQAIPHFRGASSERTWVYRIAHNVAISVTTSQRRRQSRELPMTGFLDRPSQTPDPDGALILREKREAMLAAIRELPAIDRQIVILHLEGLSHPEIEAIAGISQNAIATRLSRIRIRLSDAVQKEDAHR